MKKTILVTGGAGYIGSHTCVELINSGYTPFIIDDFSNSEKFIVNRIEEITGIRPDVIEGDCSDLEFLKTSLKNIEIHGCIHFAASKAVGESSENPLKYYKNNIGSIVSVLQWMYERKVSNFVFSSSCTVYGQPDILPVTEASPRKQAESPYGRTKQICEDIIEDYVKSGSDIKSIALRYFNPIGAHPSGLIGELPLGKPNNLVPFITQTAIGKRQGLTVFGDDYDTTDGTCIRDYIHVVDLAKAHVTAIEYNHRNDPSFNEFINIGTGVGHSVLEVIRTFESVNNIKLNYEMGSRRPGDIEKVYADSNSSFEKLGWKAEKSLSEALKDSWNWEQKLNLV